MSMEDPKEGDDNLYIVDVQPRQVGRSNAAREWIAALEAQGKKVVVIGMDSPRPPLLGAMMAPIGDPDLDAVDVFRSQHPHLLNATKPTLLERPSAGKSILMSSLDRMFPPEESSDAMLDRFMTSMMMPSREWLDPIPDPIQKPVVEKQKNKLGFLDGLGYKKRKHGNQK